MPIKEINRGHVGWLGDSRTLQAADSLPSRSEYLKEWRVRRKAEGKCPDCGDYRLRGKSCCRLCLDKKLQRRSVLKQAGRCSNCGIDNSNGLINCDKCRMSVLIWQRQRRAERLEAGLCLRCGKGLTVNMLFRYCFDCRINRAKREATTRGHQFGGLGRQAALVDAQCDNCGLIHYRPNWLMKIKGKKFCSQDCRYLYSRKRVNVSCGICTTSVELKACRLGRSRHFFCSRRCYAQFLAKPASVLANARRTRGHYYPHSTVEEVGSYLTIKQATRKVEQCLTQTK